MRLQQILGGLTPAEKSALKVLDESGRFCLMYDAALEDGWAPGGQRSRTFQKKGRYPLVLMFNPGKPNPLTGLFFEPETEIASEPVKFRPVPWTDEPIDKVADPEPAAPIIEESKIEILEVDEVVDESEPEQEPEPYHKAARSHHKAGKLEIKVKKKKHK